MSRKNSFSLSDKGSNMSFSRNNSWKNNSEIINSTSKEILGAFWGFESNASIEIRPALYKKTFEELTRLTKTKNSTDPLVNETNHSIWHKFQTGAVYMKGSIGLQ